MGYENDISKIKMNTFNLLHHIQEDSMTYSQNDISSSLSAVGPSGRTGGMEQEEITVDPKIKNIGDIIASRAKQYVSENPNFLTNVLYRGGTKYGDVSIKKVKKDRKPRDNSWFVHAVVDNYFNKRFGLLPRSKGMFVTGNEDLTQGYASHTINVVIPLDAYKIVWSPKIVDMVYYINQFILKKSRMKNPQDPNQYFDKTKDNILDISRTMTHPSYDAISHKDADQTESVIHDALDNGHYTTKNIEAAIKSGHEIMLMCDDVLIMDEGFYYKNIDNIKQYLKTKHGI